MQHIFDWWDREVMFWSDRINQFSQMWCLMLVLWDLFHQRCLEGTLNARKDSTGLLKLFLELKHCRCRGADVMKTGSINHLLRLQTMQWWKNSQHIICTFWIHDTDALTTRPDREKWLQSHTSLLLVIFIDMDSQIWQKHWHPSLHEV